ncbi:hypothetical protein JXA12_02915 [Candidatus Woesearchaeota archaeon]|nr:hypothetical protein [Candidatus Woesearchaeota archaeon]
MSIPFEQSLVNWLLLGGVVAILYGLRYLVLLERRLASVEENIREVLRRLELDEREILLREKLIEKAVLKRSRK